jgi:hypothetical protein
VRWWGEDVLEMGTLWRLRTMSRTDGVIECLLRTALSLNACERRSCVVRGACGVMRVNGSRGCASDHPLLTKSLKAEAGSTSYASRYRPCMGSTEIRPGHRGYPRVDLRRRRQCQFYRCRCRCARSGHLRLSVSSRVLAFIDRQTWSR